MPKERKFLRPLQYFTHNADISWGDILSWGYLEDLQIVTILENGEKGVTLYVKPPRCLKNKPLQAMEQDFYEDFEGWLYNESIAEAVISLFDKSKGES
ncbi:hypothetical protein Hanom_Chr07g00626571 [Helianthus anomalus]